MKNYRPQHYESTFVRFLWTWGRLGIRIPKVGADRGNAVSAYTYTYGYGGKH